MRGGDILTTFELTYREYEQTCEVVGVLLQKILVLSYQIYSLVVNRVLDCSEEIFEWRPEGVGEICRI